MPSRREINNFHVRRSSICWRGRRELIPDASENQKSWLWRHCRRRAIYWLLRSPSQTCHAKPKTQINRRRTLPASFPVGGCLPQVKAIWKTSLRKAATLWHCSRLRSVALYLWLIVVDIRQAIDRCSNIWASLPGAGYGQFEHKADSLIAKFKEAAERSERLMYEQSHRDYLRRLSASSSACHGLLIITVITPLPTKPSATKMPENWSWRTRQLLTCRCVSVMLLRSMQNTRRS